MSPQRVDEEFQYEDLSPVRKAASRLSRMLPDNNMTLSDETWHLFHFETDDFAQMRRTIDFAYMNVLGQKAPEHYSMSKFIQLLREEANVKTEKELSYERIQEALPKVLLFVRKPIFVCFNSPEKLELQIIKVFVRICAEKRNEQNAYQIGNECAYPIQLSSLMPLSNNLFFVSYGDACVLPKMLLAAQAVITYPTLNEDDFRTLLWEYHIRTENFRRMKLQKEGLPTGEIKPFEVKDKLIFEWYANRMSGLEEIAVRRLLSSMNNRAPTGFINYLEDKKLVDDAVIEYKNNILQQHNRLTLISVPEKETVVGLKTLEAWLEKHKKSASSYKESPTGIMLVGIPGTGKSATAREVARQLELPLVQLDMSNILGGLVGDSEKGMKEMLSDLKFVAPCVLWIDEIEKAMSGADGKSGDGGVIQRLFGMLLTFIQENDKPVFTVTTANDISRLPPEFFRNGRFDQTFSLMMPTYSECYSILELALNGYRGALGCDKLGVKDFDFKNYDISSILNACLGTPDQPRFLTGADIKAHVKELVYRDFKVKKDPVQEIAAEMQKIAKGVRAQASPAAAHTMEDIAARYLDMMQRGLTMAGDPNTPYKQDKLHLDSVLYYTFDENHPKLPLCIEEPEGFDEYKNIKGISGETSPAKWYDARFFYELSKTMTQIIFLEENNCLPQTQNEFWKYMSHKQKQQEQQKH